jgi:hypothetical protein
MEGRRRASHKEAKAPLPAHDFEEGRAGQKDDKAPREETRGFEET